jgi:hypothetical protein
MNMLCSPVRLSSTTKLKAMPDHRHRAQVRGEVRMLQIIMDTVME